MEIQLGLLRKRLAERDITLEISDAAKTYLAQQGYDPAYGARPLKRLIQKEIHDRIALALLKGEFRDCDTVRVDERSLELVFEKVAGAPAGPEGQVAEPAHS
jgi:ATP-dependent Clp protease ATP-binding subunit ClpB